MLVGAHAANTGVLKGGQDPFCEFFGEPDVVVEQEGDFGLDLGDGATQLAALVGLADGQHLDDFGAAQLLDHLVDSLDARVRGDQQQLERLEAICALDRLLELLEVFSNGGDDDGHVLGGDGGVVDGLDGPVGPIAREVDPEPDISEQTAAASQRGTGRAARATHKRATNIQSQLQLGNRASEKGNMATTNERGGTERGLGQVDGRRRSHRMVGVKTRLHRGSSGCTSI